MNQQQSTETDPDGFRILPPRGTGNKNCIRLFGKITPPEENLSLGYVLTVNSKKRSLPIIFFKRLSTSERLPPTDDVVDFFIDLRDLDEIPPTNGLSTNKLKEAVQRLFSSPKKLTELIECLENYQDSDEESIPENLVEFFDKFFNKLIEDRPTSGWNRIQLITKNEVNLEPKIKARLTGEEEASRRQSGSSRNETEEKEEPTVLFETSPYQGIPVEELEEGDEIQAHLMGNVVVGMSPEHRHQTYSNMTKLKNATVVEINENPDLEDDDFDDPENTWEITVEFEELGPGIEAKGHVNKTKQLLEGSEELEETRELSTAEQAVIVLMAVLGVIAVITVFLLIT